MSFGKACRNPGSPIPPVAVQIGEFSMNKIFVWNGTEYSDEELKERFDSLGKKGE